MSKFTKEQLREIDRAGIDLFENEQRDLAAFALAQMERAENAEAERDRLKKELEEAMVDQYYTQHGKDCMEAAKILDTSAGGYPEHTYVGKNTTVADLNKEVMRWNSLYFTLKYQYDQKCTEVEDLETKVKKLEETVETLEGWIENW